MLWLQRWSSSWWTFLVQILSSCHGRGGCRWHFLIPLIFFCVIPRADSYTIFCAYPPMTPLRVQFSFCDGCWLWWQDTLKVQTATSGHHVMRESRESSSFSLSRTPSSIILASNSKFFYLVFRELRECSQNSSSVFIFLELLFNFQIPIPFPCTFSANFAILL